MRETDLVPAFIAGLDAIVEAACAGAWPSAHAQLVALSAQTGEPALSELEAALSGLAAGERSPKPEPGLATVSAALAEAVTPEEMVEVLALYTRTFPYCDAGRQTLGQVLFSFGELEPALEALVGALELNAHDLGTYDLLGMTLEALGEPAWAAVVAATAEGLDPVRIRRAKVELPAESALAPALAERLRRALELAQPSVSACMIVKNEAERLGRCLESLQGWVDELVVVDTGSTDDTLAIAEAHGARVGRFEWCDDFAAARNASLEMATGDWVLVIDADEQLEVADPAEWVRALRERKHGGYLIDQVNVFASRATPERNPLARLFHNDARLRFRGRLHENVESALVELEWPVETLGGVSLPHDGYVADAGALEARRRRNLGVARLEAEARPDSPQAWALLGVAAFAAGEHPEALAAFTRMRTLEGEPRGAAIDDYDKTMQCFAATYGVLGRFNEAAAVLEGVGSWGQARGALLALRAKWWRRAGEEAAARIAEAQAGLYPA